MLNKFLFRFAFINHLKKSDMKKNVGKIDTWIRILIALGILVLYWFDKIPSTTLQIILLCLGIVLLLTSLFGFCPLYSILKINTCKKEKE